MLLAHEHQHNETMLQLLQMVEAYEPAEVDGSAPAEPIAEGPEMVLVEGGEREIGAPPEGFAYDNERPRHSRRAGGRSGSTARRSPTPTTSPTWRRPDAEPPMYWERDGGGGWIRTAMGRTERGRSPAAGHPCLLA